MIICRMSAKTTTGRMKGGGLQVGRKRVWEVGKTTRGEVEVFEDFRRGLGKSCGRSD